jgi:rhamnulokinase
MTAAVAAVDLGATSGRVMVGHVGPTTLDVRQVARFANGPVAAPDGLHWEIHRLFADVLDGLRAASNWDSAIASIGVDSWAVDYGLLAGGRLLHEPFHYRDQRTAGGVAAVHAVAPHAELYARNGLQYLPFNSLYQLAAEHNLERADQALLIPDLLAYFLTGNAAAEATNASTTGLLNVATGEWDWNLIDRLGLPHRIFPDVIQPGTQVGTLMAHIASATGLTTATPVVAVGSHDTASAIVATPMAEPGGAYISCGTWGLVGVETPSPILSDAAREANFTNEGGVDGRTRFLHNVMGLWLLSETMRQWEREGDAPGLERLLAEATAITDPITLFNVNDDAFMAPGDMPARISAWFGERGLPSPTSKPHLVRTIIESLAQAFAEAAHLAAQLAQQPVRRIHITGGGALNELLCQRTADRAGLPVLAGPVEATAIGNVLIQGRAIGAVSGSLEALRSLVATAFSPRVFEPKGL